MNDDSFLHDDLQYMRTLCKNVFNDYKNKYNELDNAQKMITNFDITWTDYFLKYKPLCEQFVSRKKIKIYKNKPKTVPFIYGTKFDINNSNKPYYCSCFNYDLLYQAQFFIYNKFLQDELILLFFIKNNSNIDLQRVEVNIKDIVTGKIQHNYVYGLFEKLVEYDNPRRFEYELEEKFMRDEYFYENDLVTQVKRVGDRNGTAKVIYKKNKDINFIGSTIDFNIYV